MDHPKLQRAVEDLVRAVGGHVDREHPAFLAIIVPLSGPAGQERPPVNVVDAPLVAAADQGAKPDLLTVNETAAALRCSTGHVKKLVAAGTLPSVTVGGRLRRIRREDLDTYIRNLT